LTARSP